MEFLTKGKLVYCGIKIIVYLCSAFKGMGLLPFLNGASGCSAVRLAHLLWEQGSCVRITVPRQVEALFSSLREVLFLFFYSVVYREISEYPVEKVHHALSLQYFQPKPHGTVKHIVKWI